MFCFFVSTQRNGDTLQMDQYKSALTKAVIQLYQQRKALALLLFLVLKIFIAFSSRYNRFATYITNFKPGYCLYCSD